MGFLSGRHSRRLLGLAAFAFILGAHVAGAQTAVLNPRTLTFTPSADHHAVLSDGRPAVDHYNFDVYSVGAAQPFQSTNIGKPAPAADGQIYYDFSASVAAWPLPGGNYEARVVAVGPSGSGTSSVSNPFTFSSCSYALSGTGASLPAAGGGTQVTVTTSSGCSWTAVSTAAWVVASPTSATGTATVVATIAANTSTTSRATTLTVAGRPFTITQGGTSVALPSAPSSPSPAAGATGASTTPTLTWTAAAATSYSVAFGTTNPPAQVASGLATPSYSPGSLSAGVTYYWRVTATSGGGSTSGSVWSFTTATTSTAPAALPAPWTSRDIGTVVLAGSARASNGVFTVVGSGADIWGTADAFHYASQPVTGNVEVIARVTALQNTNQYAKAGIMLRQGLTSNAAHVMLNLIPGGGVEFMTRAATGATAAHLASATQATPAWLKLARIGNTVSAAISADGATWRTVGSTTVTMSTSGYAGLAVTSHNTSVVNTGTFDRVSVTALGANGLPVGWNNQDVGSVRVAGSAAYSAGKYTVAGAGSDIWGTADSFQFAYRALPGDGQIVARVTAVQNTSNHAKAGVMLRGGLTASSPHVVLDLKPDGGVEFMTRSASGGSTSYLGGTTQAAPCWLRLVRTGSTVTASVSGDGSTWRTVGSTRVSFGSAYLGLVVTSHNSTTRNTSTFDNVSVR